MTPADPGNVLGIDPGVRGGWWVMNIMSSTAPVAFGVTPTFPAGKGSALEYDIPSLARILKHHQPKAIFIEEVRCYPIGFEIVAKVRKPRWPAPKAILKLGRGATLWEGVAVALGISVTKVPPKDWQAAMFRGRGAGKTSALAIEKAVALFPGTNFVPARGRLPHDGIAVAALICEYGRRQVCGLHMDMAGAGIK